MALIAATMGPAPLPAQARQPDPQDGAVKEHGQDITVKGQRPGCTGQTKAQPIDYACLNGELKTVAEAAQPAPSTADAATSQATTPSRVGTFSHTATAQRMGSNFGKSAKPYRPPAPNYSNPVREAGPR